jgi:hypothetical protein
MKNKQSIKELEFETVAKLDSILIERTKNFDLVGIILRCDELRIKHGINPVFSATIQEHNILIDKYETYQKEKHN